METPQPSTARLDRLLLARRNRHEGIPDPSFDNLNDEQLTAAILVEQTNQLVTLVMGNLGLP